MSGYLTSHAKPSLEGGGDRQGGRASGSDLSTVPRPNESVLKMSSRRYRYQDGWKRALRHIAAAGAFSAEVDGTDRTVKDVFFRLSGVPLDAFFSVYRQRYGAAAADYARDAREKWRRGEVTMSGLVSQRLYAVIPAFMSTADKQRVVAALWRRYATRSHRYMYVGRDVSVNDAMARVEEHFDKLLSFGNLALSLTSRFEWLTDNDAVETRRLVANFVDDQKAMAFTTARASVVVMRAAMQDNSTRNLDTLSHSFAVGEHVLTLKADPLRVGLLVSESAFARIEPPSRFDVRGIGSVVALVVVAVVIFGAVSTWPNGSSSGGGYSGSGGYGGRGYGAGGGSGRSGSSGSGSAGHVGGAGPASAGGHGGSSGSEQSVTTSSDSAAGGASGAAGAGDGRHALSSAQIAARVHGAGSSPSRDRSFAATGGAPNTPPPKPTPRAVRKHVVLAPVAKPTHALSPNVAFQTADQEPPGCSPRRVARVGSEGTSVDLDDGEHVVISNAGIMRIHASSWATGEDVTVCAATNRHGLQSVSIEAPKHYAKVQGTLAYISRPQPVSCSDQELGSMGEDGQVLKTTDGATYAVSANGIMRIHASEWSTGDSLLVCTARVHDGEIAGGLTNPRHYATVQATRLGVAAPSTVSCKTSRVVAVEKGGQTLELSGHVTYQISSAGIMRIHVANWTTGEAVQVCISSAKSGADASIENAAHYAKVQATRY
jgi:hypothetical protein